MENNTIDSKRLQDLGVVPDMSWVYQKYYSKPGVGSSLVFPSSVFDVTDIAKNSKYGESRYDKYATTIEDLQGLENLRSSHQSAALKLLNGLGKMTTTAATTFVSSTLGSLYGLGKGLYNLVDGDDNTGFRDGLWDNSIVSAMQSIQDRMESVLPNYYSTAERENAWYSNIFTANFWGDKFLKNAGFTIGAMATMAVPGFKNFFGIGKGIANIGKAFANTTKGLQMAEKAGKIAMRVGNTLISAAGEANIEAYNGAKAFMDTQETNINRAYNEAIQNINDEFDQNINNGMGYAQAKRIYDQKINNIENEKRDLLTQAKQHATDVGNSIFTLNMGILSASNNIQFSRLLSGGWNSSKRLMQKEGVKLLVNGKETNNFKAWGKALAKGNASLEGATKSYGKNMLLGTTENMLSEGSEELLQNLAAGTSQAVHSAEVNQYIKERTTNGNPYSLYAKSINPEVTDELVSWTKALGKVWQDEFGKASAGGWEEFVLGALTGGLGTVSVRKKNNGKVGLSWQGGFYEAYKDIKEENAENEIRAGLIKSYINNPKFKENTLHAVAAMSIAEDMDKALRNNDVLHYKNLEMMALANDANFFRNKGMIDAYKGYFEEIANGISDTDVENIKTLTSEIGINVPNTIVSYYSEKSNDEIKKLFRDKAKSNLNKVIGFLDNIDKIQVKYWDFLNKAANGDYEITNTLVNEIAVYQSMITDMQNRKNNPNLSNKEQKKLEEEIDKVQSELNKILKKPEEKINEYRKIEERAEKIRNGKDEIKTIESFRKANTIKDVADVYYFTDENNRTTWFKKALKTAEGSNKKLLQNFEKFAIQAGALHSIVSKYVSNYAFNKQQQDAILSSIGYILDDILQNIANDENTRYSTESLADALDSYIQDNEDTINETRFLKDALYFTKNELNKLNSIVNQQQDISSKKSKDESEPGQVDNSYSTDSTDDQEGNTETLPISSILDSQEQENAEIPNTNNNNNNNNNNKESTAVPEITDTNDSAPSPEELSIQNRENKQPTTVPTTSIMGMDTEYNYTSHKQKETRKGIEYLKKLRPGADLDFMCNVLLGEIYKNNKKQEIPISFVSLHDVNAENGKFYTNIYIAVDASLIPDSFKYKYKVEPCTFGNKVIIGYFYPVFKKNKNLEEQWNLIKNNLLNKESNNGIYISDHTSSIYDMNMGDLPYVTEGSFNSIKDLIGDSQTNPLDLNVKNLRFVVTLDGPVDNYVNFKKGDKLEPSINKAEPGTVILYLPTVKGTWAPGVKIIPSFYNSSHINKESTYWQKIQEAIDNVIDAKTVEDRRVAVSKLIGGDNSFLVPSTSKNHTLFYGTDANNRELFNKIIITTANNDRKVIDFNNIINEEDINKAKQDLRDGLSLLNPGIALNTKDLESESVRNELVDADILICNAPVLYFKNVQPYIRPLDHQGNVITSDFRSPKTPTPTVSNIAINAYVLNNVTYKRIGEDWYTNEGDRITEKEEIKILDELYDIINNPEDRLFYSEENIYKAKSGTLYKRLYNNNYEKITNPNKVISIENKVNAEMQKKTAISELNKVTEKLKNEENKNNDMKEETLPLNAIIESSKVTNTDSTENNKTTDQDSTKEKIISATGIVLNMKKSKKNKVNKKENSIFASLINNEKMKEELSKKGYDVGNMTAIELQNLLQKDPNTSGILDNIKGIEDTENINTLIEKIKCIKFLDI